MSNQSDGSGNKSLSTLQKWLAGGVIAAVTAGSGFLAKAGINLQDKGRENIAESYLQANSSKRTKDLGTSQVLKGIVAEDVGEAALITETLAAAAYAMGEEKRRKAAATAANQTAKG